MDAYQKLISDDNTPQTGMLFNTAQLHSGKVSNAVVQYNATAKWPTAMTRISFSIRWQAADFYT